MAEFVFASKVTDIVDGQILAISIDETPIALARIDGHIVAFGDVCSHDDGTLAEGEIDGDCIVCPRHGARFNVFTGKATFPAAHPIPIYETKIVGENVEVKLAE